MRILASHIQTLCSTDELWSEIKELLFQISVTIRSMWLAINYLSDKCCLFFYRPSLDSAAKKYEESVGSARRVFSDREESLKLSMETGM
jgi:hypothetical protein